MQQIRCKNCNRLLYIQNGSTKQIKTSDKIEYDISGDVKTTCKCGTVNK